MQKDMKKTKSMSKEIRFTHDVLDFLEVITKPDTLDYQASKAEFIRNEVLREIREKVRAALASGRY